MIRIVLGNVGSGKTAMVVRDMMITDSQIYSNIITKKIKNNHIINKQDIIKQTLIKKKNDGTDVYKYEFNQEFWVNLQKKIQKNNQSLSVVIDEAHAMIDARRSMSKKSEVMTDFLALLRRVLGSSDGNYGELVLISQLERRIDVIAREMATIVQYCICHYSLNCSRCGTVKIAGTNKDYIESNETPNKLKRCPNCNKKLERTNFVIEVHSFENIENYHMWEVSRKTRRPSKTFYERYYITDIMKVFPYYNTHQWESLLSD